MTFHNSFVFIMYSTFSLMFRLFCFIIYVCVAGWVFSPWEIWGGVPSCRSAMAEVLTPMSARTKQKTKPAPHSSRVRTDERSAQARRHDILERPLAIRHVHPVRRPETRLRQMPCMARATKHNTQDYWTDPKFWPKGSRGKGDKPSHTVVKMFAVMKGFTRFRCIFVFLSCVSVSMSSCA